VLEESVVEEFCREVLEKKEGMWCREVLVKSVVEKCWRDVLLRSVGEECCREVLEKRVGGEAS